MGIDNHPNLDGFYFESYLVGTYWVKSNMPIPDDGINGPRSFTVSVDGTFKDGGLTGWTEYHLNPKRTWSFTLDSQSGHIGYAGGPMDGGGGTQDPSGLVINILGATPVMDEQPATVHTVTVEVAGDIGVEGGWEVNGGGAIGTILNGLISWTGLYSWSKNLGVWYTNAQIKAVKGASN